MPEVKRPFKVEEQLLCWILEIEIEEQKWGASANFEGENCGGKRRRSASCIAKQTLVLSLRFGQI